MFYLDELEPELEAPFYDSDEEEKCKHLLILIWCWKCVILKYISLNGLIDNILS